jgi:hypothetical protein
VGELMQGTGGLRKLRIALPGRGKRSSARVIYYWRAAEDRFYLLMAYAKSAQSDLTADQRARLSAAMKAELENG